MKFGQIVKKAGFFYQVHAGLVSVRVFVSERVSCAHLSSMHADAHLSSMHADAHHTDTSQDAL